jgi:hypothetical protein
MNKNNFNINSGEFEIVDGKVVITSDELAMAITDQQLDLEAGEEAEDSVTINFYCPKK